METLPRAPAGACAGAFARLPPRQVPEHDRAAVDQLAVGVGVLGLHQAGPERAAAAPQQGDVAVHVRRRGAGRSAARRRGLAGDHEVGEAAAQEPGLAWRRRQPSGKGPVDVEDAALGVGGEETRRQVVQEVGQHFLFAVADGLELAVRGDVPGPPQGVAAAAGHGMHGDAPPLDGARGRAQAYLRLSRNPCRGAGAQAGEILRFLLAPGEMGGDGLERHRVSPPARRRHGEQPVKGGVRIHHPAVGGGDETAFRAALGGGQQQFRDGIPGAGPAHGPGQREQQRQGQGGEPGGGHGIPGHRPMEHRRRHRQHHRRRAPGGRHGEQTGGRRRFPGGEPSARGAGSHGRGDGPLRRPFPVRVMHGVHRVHGVHGAVGLSGA